MEADMTYKTYKCVWEEWNSPDISLIEFKVEDTNNG